MPEIDTVALIGTSVAHCLWIGALVGACTAAALRVLRQATPVTRYWLAMAALAITAGVPVLVLLGDSGRHAWLPWLGLAWLAGAGARGIRLVHSLRLVQQLRRSARPAPQPWQSGLADPVSALGVRRFVALEESDVLEVPCSVGVWRPAIIMPAGMLDRLTPPDVTAIAAHELAHVVRRDYLWNLVQVGFGTVLFFHPVASWLSRVIQRERELCCDAIASSICEPLAVARALASLESQRDPSRAPVDASGEQPLLERVRALVSPSGRSRANAIAANAGAAILLVTGGGLVFSILLATGVAGAPSPSQWMPWLTAAGLGLVIGLRHAFEPDHLVAVATLVQQERHPREAVRLGASWGVGHTLSLFTIGAGLTLARRAMPETAAVTFEAAVAAMVIVIGIRAVYLGWRLGRSGPQEQHRHGTLTHTHAAPAEHMHIGPLTLARQPLFVGVVHGLAGSGALTTLALSSLSSLSAQLTFILLFGLGSMVGMAAIAGLAGWPLARFVRNPWAAATLSVATGLAAITLGVTYGQPLLVSLLTR